MAKKKLTAQQAAYNKSRQAYMRAAGYDVPQDGSWGPWQESVWNKLTTRQKQYDTTLSGLAEGVWDKVTGNDTYRINPIAPATVKKYNPDEVDWGKTRRSQSKVINAISGTYLPAASVASLPAVARTAFSAPLATAGTLLGGYVGGKAVNKTSEALTGRDFGTNVAMNTPLTPGMGDMLNPGYYYGAPRGTAAGDFLQTMLTNKSNATLKPLTREYLGKPYYNNIRPSAYANGEADASSRNSQIFNMGLEFLTPRFLRPNVSDPNHMPNWIIDKTNPSGFEIFRNDAHRLSMGLKPHQELLSDGKMHSLYVKKPSGKYDVDWDYIRHVKKQYPDKDISKNIPTDFPNSVKYYGDPSTGQVVANDLITLNGGFANYKFLNPRNLKAVKPAPLFPTHYSTGNVLFTDTWDVQPFIDGRTFSPLLTKSMTAIENKNIPVLSKTAHNIKNVELVDAFGGKPFTQETLLPDQTIFWYPNKETIEQQITNMKRNKIGKWEILK